MRIQHRVIEHPGRQWPERPVGALKFLLQFDAEVPLQQRGEPERADPQELGGDSGVEDILRACSVVLSQQPQVVIGVVENDFGGVVTEGFGEPRQGTRVERVNDHIQVTS